MSVVGAAVVLMDPFSSAQSQSCLGQWMLLSVFMFVCLFVFSSCCCFFFLSLPLPGLQSGGLGALPSAVHSAPSPSFGGRGGGGSFSDLGATSGSSRTSLWLYSYEVPLQGTSLWLHLQLSGHRKISCHEMAVNPWLSFPFTIWF